MVPEKRGVVAIVWDSAGAAELIVDLVASTELSLYFHTANQETLRAVRETADKAGVLGTRVFSDFGGYDAIPLSHNLADAVIVEQALASAVSKRSLANSSAHGADSRGVRQSSSQFELGRLDSSLSRSDNNTQSDDQLVR